MADISLTTLNALKSFNADYSKAWDWGTNWSSVNTDFETFVNKYLFPKINETLVIDKVLGNRFNWLAKEKDFIGQYSEEYVILDTVPVTMNLTKSEELMLKRNYPNIASKLYGNGILKKVKFTLNNNDVRFNFSTLGDGINYALAVYNKKLSDINVTEESEIKAMLLDYSLNVTQEKREVESLEDLSFKLYEALLNMQNNSAKYNETNLASGGAIGRYTTQTKKDKFLILTTDTIKAHLLDTKIANTFQVSGLDLTDRIISFDDLGGVYKLTQDVTLNSNPTIQYLHSFGDYQAEKGDKIPKDSIFTFDVSGQTDFTGKVEEIKPSSDLYAYIFDVDKVRYTRYTKNMIKSFYNPEFDEVNYWIHYYSTKAISPFFNNILLQGKTEEVIEDEEV